MQSTTQSGLAFLKMHGLGNDFVVVDARGNDDPITAARAKAIGNRFFGVGFDQLVVIKESEAATARVDFWNSDGSRAGACGNASRCIGRLLMDETGLSELTLETDRGILTVQDAGGGLIRVNMGQPELTWETIPLARDVDLINLPIEGSPGAAGMGNPHMVFVVDDVEQVALAQVGPGLEHHPLFPERTNVEFLQILDRSQIRMRVWERGGMITLACGSGACAAAVVAHRKGLTDRHVTIHLDGGALDIDWREDGVWMTGESALVFQGYISQEFLDSVK